ncbi:hypothetical protein V6N13_086943 [Hibiscus sabdariffa]|uniref:PRONE domain-containing protein n=1 Tax=Hibiscus sabdariffa TaxID=183260 RepID=A0ABR2FUQ8_9ROSI
MRLGIHTRVGCTTVGVLQKKGRRGSQICWLVKSLGTARQLASHGNDHLILAIDRPWLVAGTWELVVEAAVMRREIDWILCVTDSIVELKPSLQEFLDGGSFEVMVVGPRSDLLINLSAIKKLDAMLISILDGFHDSEFYYADRGVVINNTYGIEAFPSSSPSGSSSARLEKKWWLPFPKILKVAMAINNIVLAEMEIPNAYLKSLPKYGNDCLGEIMYRYLTADQFSRGCLLDYFDLSSDYTALEMANGVED